MDRRRGYEHLFNASVEQLCDPEELITQGVVCLEHYFNLVGRILEHDWPQRGVDRNTSLKYAKMIAGFVKLLLRY